MAIAFDLSNCYVHTSIDVCSPDGGNLFYKNGMPKPRNPSHWKGESVSIVLDFLRVNCLKFQMMPKI
ncbi:hypothetical protein LguiB_010030 [Lonicera macranthoides]